MKKMWEDVKSCITILSTIVYLVCILLKLDILEYFQTVYVMEMGFYFGTQFQKNIKEVKENA